jgi:CMP/dCMP kinase
MTDSSPRRLIIAIDGPAGAGKSTIASRLARKLGYVNLESGAMYRALALRAIECDASFDDEDALLRMAQDSRITLDRSSSWQTGLGQSGLGNASLGHSALGQGVFGQGVLAQTWGGNRVLLNGKDVSARIRERDVTEAASRVSVHPKVRAWMVERQREMGIGGGVVMEGRDIGTKVFPDADLKIFLDADPVIREQRRLDQQQVKGAPAQAMAAELRERDLRDRTRAVSPLVAAEDAIVIDSTNLSEDDVVNRIEKLVEQRLAATR